MPRCSMQPFGPTVSELLYARAWSQRELADAVEVDPAHVSRLLRPGARPATPRLIERIAAALDVPPEFFLEYREWRVIAAVRADPGLRERLYRRHCARGSVRATVTPTSASIPTASSVMSTP